MRLILGDCLEKMKDLEDNSVDSIVTDPPYGLSFMGKEWDHGVPGKHFWEETLRVAKPGAHILAFGGTRTYHRLACALEDAGWEIRDCIAWVYGQGFPKSQNILNTIAKELQCKVEKVSVKDVESLLCQSLEVQEMDGVNFVQGNVWGSINKKENIISAYFVEKNFILQNVMQKEKTEGIKEPFVLLNVKQTTKKDLQMKIILIGKAEDFYEAMDMLQLTLEIQLTDSNMILLWRNILDALYKSKKKCTILTEIEQIIGLRIYNFLLNPNTQNCTTLNHTALKPAFEPIILARKPIEESTVAGNVLKHGTGALNIDGCRIPMDGEEVARGYSDPRNRTGAVKDMTTWAKLSPEEMRERQEAAYRRQESMGRWPANLIHDGSDEVVALFPETKSGFMKADTERSSEGGYMGGFPKDRVGARDTFGDSSSAARFFYCAKASKSDRDEGLDGFEKKIRETEFMNSKECIQPDGKLHEKKKLPRSNIHPTVKPTSLMQYLCRLITPKNGIILDPFMGSGSTGKAAILEGFDFIGIEKEAEYLEIAKARLDHAMNSIRKDKLI